MTIAIVGCIHGGIEKMYTDILEKQGENKVDLILCTGDFQAVRDYSDMQAIDIPKR